MPTPPIVHRIPRHRKLRQTPLIRHRGRRRQPHRNLSRPHRQRVIFRRIDRGASAHLGRSFSDRQLIARAEQVGIGLISAAPQYLGESPSHEFIFSYTELDEGAIATGIEKLDHIVF
ncbi:MAG: hypothetical protein WBG32_14130 [Nodosilinea sp.]